MSLEVQMGITPGLIALRSRRRAMCRSLMRRPMPRYATGALPGADEQRRITMRYLKILGLALIAATALMAFAGAGTASAETTACKVTETPCSVANGYRVGQEIHAISIEGGGLSQPTLTAPLGNVHCNSTIKGKLARETTPLIEVEELTWTQCEGGTAETKKLGNMVIHHDTAENGEHNGSVTLEGFVVKVVQAGITCYYSSEGIEGTLTAGVDPIVHITAEPTVLHTAEFPSSSFCPAKAPWHATYTVTTPQPIYITTGV